MGVLDILTSSGAEVIGDPVQVQKAFAYIRVSHEDSADRNTSLETQRSDIQRYASSEGIEILEWFEEPGKSAFKDDSKRTQFVRMVRMAKENTGVSLLLVWKSDRFSRDRYQAAAVKGELQKVGVRVLSVLEPYDARTTSGIVLESVTDAMNQIRSIEIGQVTHRNMLTNCEMRDPGTGWAYKNGGWAQFGYRNHRIYTDTYRKYQRISHCIWMLDDEMVAGNPVHAWVRKMLIEWRLGEGVGMDVIARRLTEAGVPTPSGRSAWSDSTINCLFMPERLIQYAGYGTWNKVDYRSGGKRQKDRSEWKIIENAHPAIITREEADAIHAVRETRRPRPGKVGRRPSPYVLSGGLLTCTCCKANYTGREKHGDDYYVCGSYVYRHGIDCSDSWYIRREDADRAAFDCIQKVLAQDSKQLRAVVTSYNKWVDSQFSLYRSTEDARQAEIRRLDGEIANLTKSLAQGVDPALLRNEINSRIAHRDRLGSLADVKMPEKITPKELGAMAAEVRQIAESRDTDRKRSTVRRYIAAMEADPQTKTIRVLMNHLSSICGHSMVAPGGVEPPPRP